MDILFLAPHYITPDDFGGVRSWQIGSYLAGQGHTVTAIVPGINPRTGEWYPEVRGHLFATSKLDGVKLIRTAAFQINRKILLSRILYYVSQSLIAFIIGLLSGRADVVLTTSHTASMLFGWLLAKLKGAAFVIDVRDLIVDAAIEVGYVKPSLWVKTVLGLEHFLFKRANRIIAVSPGWRDRLLAKGLTAKDVVMIPLGFEPKIFKAADWEHDVRKEYGFEGKFVILYAGMMGHIPDILTLLKSAEQLQDYPDIQFVLIGTGQRLEEYQKFCSEQGLTNCHFLGVMPRKMIPVFCSNCDVCVNLFPKGKFGASILGSKTFDYMASGRPLVYAGEGEGTATLIRESGGGIVVPAEDVNSLTEAILSLYQDRKLCQRMGEQGRKYILNNYSAIQLMPKIESVLLEAMSYTPQPNERE